MKTRGAVRRFAYGHDLLRVVLAALLIVGPVSVAHTAPEGGVVRAGNAQITGQGNTTLIQQGSQRAIIDWRKFGINADERVQFAQPSVQSATLNRVTGDQTSLLLGRMDANGQVFLVNPHGIIFGKGAQINVGSLIASTANISNDNFMQGKLVFDQPGRPGAGIINYGSITAAEGGLVVLVAPHIRNDGLIQARLGKVFLGAADTFTIDLYGDGLVNFALSDASLAQLRDEQGQPIKSLITQAGTIDVGGGQAVLVTAEAAKGVLDSLINMSGTILADSAVQQGGRIMLLARGGNTDVSGNLSARGLKGGQIDILGDQVRLFSTTNLDADGTYGGGVIHVGGAYQGSGDTYRAQTTFIDAGATLHANALLRGSGGEVVVWSNGETSYAGTIQARGGTEAGDGGLVEVSGKQTLFFSGLVDAGATFGKAGSLVLDPFDFTIDMTNASLISRVLRTGTSVSMETEHDMFVNYFIDGRGRLAGGGLTLTAGNNLNVNEHILTYNGAINLFTTAGSISLAPNKVVYAGTAPITVESGGNLYSASYLLGGPLSLRSTSGSIFINQGIERSNGNLLLQAAADVNVNQPIVSLSDGDTVNITAGNNINVNAQIDGRPALGVNPNGTVTMAAGQNINLTKSILASSIDLTATSGTITAPTMTAGTVTEQPNGIPLGEGLFAGTGPLTVTVGGNLSSGVYVTTGPVSIRSTGGNVAVDTKLAEILGNVFITANTGSVNVNQEIANIRSGSNLTVTAGTDINLNRQIDALDGAAHTNVVPVPGGSVTFTASNSVNVNQNLGTYNGAINLFATAGSINLASNKAVSAGTAPITAQSGGNLYSASYLLGGSLSLRSTSGSVFINQGIDSSNGNVLLQAAADVNVNQPIVSLSDGDTVSVSAGRDVNINAQIDGRPALGSDPNGIVTMTAGRDINLSKSILAGEITLTAGSSATTPLGTINAPTMTAGTVTIQPNGIPLGEGLFAGAGPISVTVGGNLSSGVYVTTGPVSIRSTGGNVTVDTKLAEILGNVFITANTGSVNVNQEIANIRSGSNLTITAGTNINLNSQINALGGAEHGSVTFTAGNNVNVNGDVITYNGPVTITAKDPTETTGTLNIGWNGAENRTYRIQTGSAPITVTAGGSLSTAAKDSIGTVMSPPPTFPWDDNWVTGMTPQEETDFKTNYVLDQLRRYVAFSTNGNLHLMSKGGNITVDAPIPNTTGEVALTAASNVTYDNNGGLVIPTDADGRPVITGSGSIIVNQKIFSNNMPVTLTAGTGGIVVNGTDDTYGGIAYWITPAIASGSGNLTLQTAGDISITSSHGIVTSGLLTIDTRGSILGGAVSQNWYYKPSEIVLIADTGITYFSAGWSPKVTASSKFGDIHLGVESPTEVNITATAGSVYTGGLLGPTVNIVAGTDINLSDVHASGDLTLTAGGNANLNVLDINSLSVTTTSGNINFNSSGLTEPFATIWLAGGNLTATSGGDILFGSATDYSAIHVGNSSLTLNATGLVDMGIVETVGPVSITAGTINLRNNIGEGSFYYRRISISDPIDRFSIKDPVYLSYFQTKETNYFTAKFPSYDPSTFTKVTYDLADQPFNVTGQGVASLTLNAGAGGITMQGAHAVGLVNIFSPGDLTAAKGIFSDTTGGVTINTNNVQALSVNSYGSGSLGDQAALARPGYCLPMVSPGPSVDSPGSPGTLTALAAQSPDASSVSAQSPSALSALPAQPPGMANVSGNVPAASSEGGEQGDPTRHAGWSSLREVIHEEGEAADDESGKGEKKEITDSSKKRRVVKIKADQEKEKIVLDFAGGRGDSQTAVTSEILGTYISGPLNASSRRK